MLFRSVGRIVSEPTMYSAWTHWVIDPLPPVLQACLPPSWWEFALDHATHVYNRTPMKRLEWRTPSEWLTGIRPSIDHLRVLGCAAYVFIPAEVRTNKLSPKSELMTYLGTAPGGKGWIFMRTPNNIVFTAAQAIFDESMFPKCPVLKM